MQRVSRMSNRVWQCCRGTALLLLALVARPVLAADFIERFDGAETSWTTVMEEGAGRLVAHERNTKIKRQGERAEQWIVDCPKTAELALTHRLSPARAIDELKASVWIRSNRPGATFALRLVYPHLKDPATGQIVTRLIEGQVYEADGTWQSLACATTEKELARRARLLRAQFGAQADLRDVHIDQAVLLLHAAPGTTELIIDELKLGPVVSPAREFLVGDPVVDQSGLPEVELRLDRLWVRGQPFVPRIFVQHGETAPELADLQVNPVWIPDYSDTAWLKELQSLGIWAMASPPVATSTTGEILDAETASLSPLGVETQGILFWMMGNGIQPTERRRLSSWREQLLAADRKLHRPLMADVTGHERAFSRLVPMLGSTQPVHQSHTDYRSYRDWLSDRQQVARPGGFQWTWLHPFPDPNWSHGRIQRRLTAPVVEPEQLRLQMYSALTAGCRGIGYWTNDRMSADNPQHAEALWQIKQLNLELQLLEPWVATGNIVGQARVVNVGPLATPFTDEAGIQQVRGFKTPATQRRVVTATRVEPPAAATLPLEATLLETDYGLLVLGVWQDPHAQYVPGQQAAHAVQILVPGVKETARAWLVTTTEIIPLETDRNAVPGGTLVTIPRWEMTVAVVISPDTSLRDALVGKMEQMRMASAQCWVELARSKWERIRTTDLELRRLGQTQADADRLLNKSRQLWQFAAEHWEQQAYAKARAEAEAALQLLRILQRAHWDLAIAELSQPLSSEHTACFATLPDYWRTRKQHPPGAWPTTNQLPSGSFDDEATFQTAGWQHAQPVTDGVRATAELIPHPGTSGHILRLAAGPVNAQAPPLLVEHAPVRVTTPAVPVRAGQQLKISGVVRVVHAVTASRVGFEVRDALSGPGQTCVWHRAGGWQRFELTREVRQSGDFQVELLLHGMGEVWVDDLRIVTKE